MRKIFFAFVITFYCSFVFGQQDDVIIEDAVTIGNINMQSVIIHVYKTKEDIYPFKEFIIMKDPDSGALKALNSKVFGKVSEGGFIIVNGLKDKSEIENLLSDEKVYDEMVVKDVEGIEAYEKVINEFIKKAILEENETDAEETQPTNSSETTNNTTEIDNSFEEDKTAVIKNEQLNSKVSSSQNLNYNKKSKKIKSKTRVRFPSSKKKARKQKSKKSNNGCYSF